MWVCTNNCAHVQNNFTVLCFCVLCKIIVRAKQLYPCVRVYKTIVRMCKIIVPARVLLSCPRMCTIFVRMYKIMLIARDACTSSLSRGSELERGHVNGNPGVNPSYAARLAMQQGLARDTRACEREPLSHVPLTPMRALSPFDLVNILSTSCSQAGTPLSELGAEDSMEEEE